MTSPLLCPHPLRTKLMRPYITKYIFLDSSSDYVLITTSRLNPNEHEVFLTHNTLFSTMKTGLKFQKQAGRFLWNPSAPRINMNGWYS